MTGVGNATDARPARRRPATAVQLAAMAVAIAGYLLLLLAGVRELRPFPPPVVALLPAALAVAALPRRRWPSLVGACLCAVALFGALVIYRATYDRLADPGQILPWAGSALQVSGLAVAVVAGILAARRAAPRRRARARP
jgi:4-amino-4-deoxy-L-arabinose transferase-like glycosyltransferase